ncbi:unnamed protein product, partial [Symbiodinium pilosum]
LPCVSQLLRCTTSSKPSSAPPEAPRLSSPTVFTDANADDGSLPTMQVFVEQMFSGVRLILSLDGIGLDVEAKLDQAWEILTLVFNGVEKTILLGGIRHVSVYKNSGPLRRLEQLDSSGDPTPFWAVRLELQDDRFCEFSFSSQSDARYFGSCLQLLIEAARFKDVKRDLDPRFNSASAEEADAAAGALTTRSVAPGPPHPAAELAQDPEAFAAALTRALEEGEFPESVAPESLMSLDAELPSDISP